MRLHCKSIAIAVISSWVLPFSLSAQGTDPYPPVPGSYRPTGELPAQGSFQRHQQFVPLGHRNPQASVYPPNPAPPRAGYYPPAPAYGYDGRQYNAPDFNFSPGAVMNDMFGSRGNSNLPYGYPPQPFSGAVAPIYDPPLPAATPGWRDYATQPAPTYYQQPAAPQYWQQPATPQYWQQPAAPQTGSLPQAAQPAYTTQPEVMAPPAPQPAVQAPRPFSSQQETGTTFVQRPHSTNLGRNDSRFRPPELKGTP